jgi:hypothetical protein
MPELLPGFEKFLRILVGKASIRIKIKSSVVISAGCEKVKLNTSVK